MKKKYIRANHSNFVTEEFSKAITLRLILKNQLPNTKTQECKMKFNKPRHLCVRISKKAKGSYYKNLDLLKDITHSKKFWVCSKALWVAVKLKQIKPTESISLEENGKIICNDKELAGIFNNLFVNTLPNLAVSTDHSFLINTVKENDPIEKAIARYKNHSSLFSIKKFMENSDSFFLSFQHVLKVRKNNQNIRA